MTFDYRESESENPASRFDDDALGAIAWRNLIERLPRGDDPPPAPILEAADAFFDDVDSIWSNLVVRPRCTVFVSHQSADTILAERIAYLACTAGLDYWLDVHDPQLNFVNLNLAPTDPRYPLLVAAIIEIALLNSSFIVNVHTDNSRYSKWTPYELGRARNRRVVSLNSGGWFHPLTNIDDHGEYVRLCRMAQGGEQGLVHWMTDWAVGCPTAKAWRRGNVPQSLPT